MKTYLLVLITLIGCEREEVYDRYEGPPLPDVVYPVVDITAHDIKPDYVVFRLVFYSYPTVGYGIWVHLAVTYKGHYEHDSNRPFEIRIENALLTRGGPEPYYGTAHRTLDSSLAEERGFHDIELPFQQGEHGIVTSVVIEILPWPERTIFLPPFRDILLGEDGPYVAGVSKRAVFFIP